MGESFSPSFPEDEAFALALDHLQELVDHMRSAGRDLELEDYERDNSWFLERLQGKPAWVIGFLRPGEPIQILVQADRSTLLLGRR